jgi:hypothetical protein
MKNLYGKVALASVSIALGFVLGANKEVKAATFILENSGFFVADTNRDGLGDWYYGGVPLPVGATDGLTYDSYGEEYRAFHEFNIAQLSLAPNTVISSAIFKNVINSVERLYNSHYDPGLHVIGYVGNGNPDSSDFSKEGVLLPSVTLWDSSAGTTFNLNVTTFVNQIVSNRESFAGFGFRLPPHINEYSPSTYVKNYITLGGYPYPSASLTITTVDAEPVPEPATIFGSVIGLYLGGWLKRKKSSQQNKITP